MKHLKRVVTALVTAGAVVAAVLYVPRGYFIYAFALLYALCLIEFFMLAARRVSVLSPQGFLVNLVGVVVLMLAFSELALISTAVDGNLWLLYVLAVVKLSDMGGFALGVAFGRHKLCPSVSPNKSWEGLAGSVIASVAMSSLFMPMTRFPFWKAALIGLTAALIGTFGDLVESRFKRWVGVKDSATFMPAGLGGFLDMFDSLLFAPTAVWLIANRL